jgi:hypothetical protein
MYVKALFFAAHEVKKELQDISGGKGISNNNKEHNKVPAT